MKIRALIFDWAGTLIDFGSKAPLEAFAHAFEAQGITLSREQIAGPMGREKRDHIRALFEISKVAEAWKKHHGHEFTSTDLNIIYDEFQNNQLKLLKTHVRPITKVVETLSWARKHYVLGGTTGYSRPIFEQILELAYSQGISLDQNVCASDVTHGRPAPDMLLVCAKKLGVAPSECLVLDDTLVGIEAAKNAGMQGIGITLTGNAAGLTESEFALLGKSARQVLHLKVSGAFLDIGAIATLSQVSDLPTYLNSNSHRKKWQF